MSMWTAASDADYDAETGNSDLWENNSRIEYHAWLDLSGFTTTDLTEMELEDLRAAYEQGEMYDR